MISLLDKSYEVKFPMLCFPIFVENGKFILDKMPVSNEEEIKHIEKLSNFHSWGRDPFTGIINLKIENINIDDIKTFIKGQKSIYEEWKYENEIYAIH